MSEPDLLAPLHAFNFVVKFNQEQVPPPQQPGGTSSAPVQPGGPVSLCGAAFSECTGIEATMEPKVIKEGGRNFGPLQRVGPVTFATVILKRGLCRTRDLWKMFELVGAGAAACRLQVVITLRDTAGQPIFSWKLHGALPIKFKTADFNAAGGSSVGIEELHLAHERLELGEA